MEYLSAGIMDSLNYCILDPSKLHINEKCRFITIFKCINDIQMGHHPF